MAGKCEKKLSELLGIDKFEIVDDDLQIEYETKGEQSTEIRFTFKTEEGYRAPAHLFIPDGIKNPPVMICLQGHTTGMHISFARPKHKGDEIAKKILDMKHGVTLLSGKGAYTDKQKNVLLCAVRPSCIAKIKSAVVELDKDAFIIVSDTKEVYGEGFGVYNEDTL